MDRFYSSSRVSFAAVRIASCPAQQGTNLLFVPRGVNLRVQYGADSRSAHVAAYAADRVRVNVAAPVPDIDTPADVQFLRETLARSPDLGLRHGAVVGAGVAYQKIDDQGLHLLVNGKPVLLEVDHVVICAGQEPQRSLYDALLQKGKKVHLIGGAYEAKELDAKRAIDQASRLAAEV